MVEESGERDWLIPLGSLIISLAATILRELNVGRPATTITAGFFGLVFILTGIWWLKSFRNWRKNTKKEEKCQE